RMILARDEAKRQVAIGYQWSFSTTIQALKKAILSDRFGLPRRLKSLCLWPRNASYYARNRWAGRKQDPESGAWILDSPVNNAMAHYLHNMLFLLGPSIRQSAEPVQIEAELFRANPIENYDTAALRVQTREGVEILFFGAHPIEENRGPVFSFEFEHAVVSCADQGAVVEVRFHDGTRESFPHPDADDQCTKLWVCMKAVLDDTPFPCSLEAARAQTLCMNGAQESMPDALSFPTSMLRRTGHPESALTWVEGLAEALESGWKHAKLLSEEGVSWAKPGKAVDLVGFNRFPSNLNR
ncbi:MAG: gfo/Idh/MocA family oxidoreductase, partial [Planctomycetota bacterium]